MGPSNLTDSLLGAEGLLVQGQTEAALETLAQLAEDAEEYVSKNCPTTESQQWFSFPTIFERLAYKRVEDDPRELLDVGEPLDRLYADLALAAVHAGDYSTAQEALKHAVRWNPMGCEHRLNLADLYRIDGDMREYLALTYSVFERASDAAHLERAYTNFCGWFVAEGKPRAAAACLFMARATGVGSSTTEALLKEAAGTDRDPDNLTLEEAGDILAEEGLPAGANAEMALCLLMCAQDCAAAGSTNEAVALTVRARDLVGEQACKALLALLNETGDE